MKKKFICSVCGYIYEGEAAPDQYVAEYIRYSTPNINEISRHLLNFCFIYIPPKLTAKPNFIKKP